MEALSEKLASGDTAGLEGHVIRLCKLPVSPPPEGLVAQMGHIQPDPEATVDGERRPGVSWVILEAADCQCWTLRQMGASLVGVRIEVPPNGRLYAAADAGRWEAVQVHGVPLHPQDAL